MASTPAADAHDPAAVVRDFYDAWVRGDADRLVAHWADDATMDTVFSTPPVPPETAPPRMEGGDTIRAFWRNVMGALARRDLHDLWVGSVALGSALLAGGAAARAKVPT